MRRLLLATTLLLHPALAGRAAPPRAEESPRAEQMKAVGERLRALPALAADQHQPPADTRQPAGEAERVARVRAAVGRLSAWPDAKVRVELRSLLRAEGTVDEAGEGDFVLMIGRGKNVVTGIRVRYSDVVRLVGGGVSLHFPGLPRDGIGTWQDVRAVEPLERVSVVLTGGREVRGMLFRSTDDGITVVNSDRRVELRREEVSRVVLRVGERTSLTRVLGAGDGGAEAARDIVSAGPVGPGIWAGRWLLRQALKGQKNIIVYAK